LAAATLSLPDGACATLKVPRCNISSVYKLLQNASLVVYNILKLMYDTLYLSAQHPMQIIYVPVRSRSAFLRASIPLGVRKTKALPRTLGGVRIIFWAV
jgi:hypothetical protein